VTRADGNPLFAEELSQSLLDSRKMTAAAQQIPSTLQDLLMARLDSLGPIKEVAQIGSVLGRAFPHSLLAAIANQAEDKLDAALLELIDSGLVFVESIQKDTIYTFKHALVQEAAYGLLLKSRRRELHLAAATALKEKFPDLAHQRPELVAHHLTEAGDTENAVEAWQNAGDYAIGRAAYAEAERHFSKALQVLKFMPESSERDHLELPLQLSIANAYKVTTGFGSDAQLIAYARAREISEQLGDSAQFLFILLGLWGASNSRSDLVTSRELSSELTRLAERDQNTMMMTWAYQTQAAEAFEQGNFADTLKQFERMCQYYKTEEQAWSPFDPKLVAYIHAALATYHAGFADKARTLIHGQYELAKDMYPGNVAMAYLGACSLYLIMHEPELLLENALPMIEIADKEDIPSYHGWGTIYRGAAYVYQGKFTEGISVLTEGISAYLATGTHSSLAQYLSVLAEGYAGAGEIEKALSIVEDAFGATGEELMHLPYLHRLRGEFLQLRGSDEDIQKAEEQYRMAIDYCQKFGSLTLELRAATRQAQLLQSKSKIVEAHALLAPLYAKFTEGFDTLYLRDAKTLLDELEIKNGEKFG